jgi:hypothetical protein
MMYFLLYSVLFPWVSVGRISNCFRSQDVLQVEGDQFILLIGCLLMMWPGNLRWDSFFNVYHGKRYFSR